MKEIRHTLRTGLTLVVREAVPDDAADILEYLTATACETDYLTFDREGPGFTLEEEVAFLKQHQQDPSSLLIIGRIEGSVVATLGYVPGSRNRLAHAGEFGMSVAQAYWNQGVGSRMVDALLDWAHEGGAVRKINLQVRTDNQPAIRMYLRNGFQFEGRNRRAMQIDAHFHDFYYMGKILES